jgi:hypothetical protein
MIDISNIPSNFEIWFVYSLMIGLGLFALVFLIIKNRWIDKRNKKQVR